MRTGRLGVAVAAASLLIACGPVSAPGAGEGAPSPSAVPPPSPSPAPPTTALQGDASPSASVAVPDPRWVVRYQVDVRAAGLDPAQVRAVVDAVLADERGWSRAGFVFVPDGPGAPRSELPVGTITVAEGDEIDRLCAPYETYGRYSCQLGATVNLSADRWRTATEEWPGDLDGYRTYLVNHEVGHLLGLHHPDPQCPGEGYPAPIMLQQSSELGACTANPWPLRWEIELAASRVEPFAPGYELDPEGRPSPPRARS